MTDQDGAMLRRIVWAEFCPWLGIFRTFRVAISARLLVLAAVAMLATMMGCGILGAVFRGPDEAAGSCPWRAVTQVAPERPWLPGFGPPRPLLPGLEPESEASSSMLGSGVALVEPFHDLLFLKTGFVGTTGLLLCGLWTLAVWAFFGGAITRSAAVQLTCDERIGWPQMLKHAMAKWQAYFGAPLLPLVGVVLAAVPIAVVCLLARANFGVLLVGLIWPLCLAGGFVMAILLLGLVFGWPLMWATISTEGTDSFDALSRAYAYVFQRPLHYLFYAFVAVAFGFLGWLLVANFAAGVIQLTYWAASWGTGAQQINNMMTGSKDLAVLGGWGANVIHFWVACVKLLAVAFLYSYFWTASTMVYLLLRRDVDATEMDEVFREEGDDEGSYGLPPLETDEAGAPVVNEPAAPDANPPEARNP